MSTALAAQPPVLLCVGVPTVYHERLLRLVSGGTVAQVRHVPAAAEAWMVLAAEPVGAVVVAAELLVQALGYSRMHRSLPRAEYVPLIWLLAKWHEGTVEQAFNAGAADYLVEGASEREWRARILTQLQLGPQSAHLAEQLEQAATVSHLATGLAQDLNHVLGGMIGQLALLRRQAEAGSGGAPWPLDLAEQAAQRAGGLVSQLLQYADALRSTSPPQPLNAAVQAIVPVAVGALPPEVRLAVELGDPAIALRVAPAQVQQVVLNLVQAVAARLPHGGTVTLRTGQWPAVAAGPVGALSQGPGACLQVSARPLGSPVPNHSAFADAAPANPLPAPTTGLCWHLAEAGAQQLGGALTMQVAESGEALYSVALPLG